MLSLKLKSKFINKLNIGVLDAILLIISKNNEKYEILE